MVVKKYSNFLEFTINISLDIISNMSELNIETLKEIAEK